MGARGSDFGIRDRASACCIATRGATTRSFYNGRMSSAPPLRPRPPLAPRHWPAWCGIGLMALAARLPWALQRALGRLIGDVLRQVLSARRRVAARNLELCLPELDATARAALLRAHFHSLGIGLFEFGRAWWGSVAPLRRGLVVEGLEHIEASRAGGRGVIVVSMNINEPPPLRSAQARTDTGSVCSRLSFLSRMAANTRFTSAASSFQAALPPPPGFTRSR